MAVLHMENKLVEADPKFRVRNRNAFLEISQERWLGGWVDRTYFGSIINIPVGDAAYNRTKGGPEISGPRKICLLWDTHVMQTNVTNWLDKNF